MEEADKGWLTTTIGVSRWMFLLVPAHPGCPEQNPESRKQLCVCLYSYLSSYHMFYIEPYLLLYMFLYDIIKDTFDLIFEHLSICLFYVGACSYYLRSTGSHNCFFGCIQQPVIKWDWIWFAELTTVIWQCTISETNSSMYKESKDDVEKEVTDENKADGICHSLMTFACKSTRWCTYMLKMLHSHKHNMTLITSPPQSHLEEPVATPRLQNALSHCVC